MEVYQTQGQEGALTICLDGAEPIVLNFKQKAFVSVSYTSTNRNVGDDNPLIHMKKEPSPSVDDDEETGPDPVNEELDLLIEKAKNNGPGMNNLFLKNSKDLFGEGVNAVPDATDKLVDTDDGSNAKKIYQGSEGKIEEGGNENDKDDDNDDVGCDSVMECDNINDDVDEVMAESADVEIEKKDKSNNDSDLMIQKRDFVECEVADGFNDSQNSSELDIDSSPKDEFVIKREKNDVEFTPLVFKRKHSESSGSSREDLIAQLMKEVAEKKKKIQDMTASDMNTSQVRVSASRPRAPVVKTTVYKCNLCDRKFKDSYLLSIHHRPENSKVTCKICNLECMSKANLIIHQHLIHSKNGRKAGKICPVCSMSFEKHTDILSHIRIQHTKEGLYKCCVCRILFQSYHTFKSHLDMHYKEKLKRERRSNLQRAVQPRAVNNSTEPSGSRQKLSSAMVKQTQVTNVQPVSSASKRKSQTPIQRKSLNYQPPSKSANTANITPPPASSSTRPSIPIRSSTGVKTPTQKPALKTPVSKPGDNTSAVKPGTKPPSVPKLVIKVPTASSSTTLKSNPSPLPIKNQVLASRLKPKPLLTPSSLASKKRPLNQLLSTTSGKSLPKLMVARSSLKTLPKVIPKIQAALLKKRLKSRASMSDRLWKCHFCERVFRSKGEYINHKKPSRITQTCKECGFTSTSKALYLVHMYQKHTNRENDRYTSQNPNLQCHICEEPIVLNEVLNHVMSKHTGEHPYECCVCKKPSKSYEDWVSHGKSHVRSKEEKSGLTNKLLLHLTVKTEETEKSNEVFCNLCKQCLPNEKEFVRHHKSETERRDCEICGVLCYTQAGYLIHRYISHGLSAGEKNESSLCLTGDFKKWQEDDSANDNSLEETKCPSCLEYFPMKDLMAHVMTLHTQESQYKCCACKTTFSTLNEYIDHCDFHLGRKLYSRGTQRCLICGLRFESRIRLSRHKAMHKPSCPYCQLEFSSKAVLDVHLKNFHTKDMTPCSFCGKLFADSGQLAEHERNHYFYKKSPCPVCGLAVTCVAKHMARVHPKPDSQFLCNLCGQKFALTCDLNRHMLTHSNDRKYECDICKKTFKRASGLRRHAQSHLQDRRFHECHICGKKCSQRNNLSVHMRVHATTKYFTCEHCGQGFNYNQSLQTHIRKKHMGEPFPNSLPSTSTTTATMSPPHEATGLVVRKVKPPPPSDNAAELMNQVAATSATPQPGVNIIHNPLVNYSDHSIAGAAAVAAAAVVYPSTDSSHHYYHPDPSGYAPVNAVAFHRSYNDLINTIVRSEQDNSNDTNNNSNSTAPPGLPQQSYPLYYPQF